jgi:predicted metal-dependent hydrolase
VVQGKKNAIENDKAFITLMVKDPTDFDQKNKTMDKWLSQTCKDTLLSVCDAVYPKFSKYGIDFPQIRFRDMISRWGSCQPKRRILTFNYSLVEAPLSCIEYVVVHEFTHFLQPNHSANFYKQLSMFMPDWKERKKVLEKNSFYME